MIVIRPKNIEKSPGTHPASAAIILSVARAASALILLIAPIFNSEAVFAADDTKPDSAIIQGIVNAVDPKGQTTPLEGISVTLSGESQGPQPLSTLTDAAGHYQFTGLAAGTYSLEANLDGFNPFVKSIALKPNDALIEEVGLELKTVTSNVEVQAEAPAIVEQSTEPDATLASRQFLALPLAEQKFREALPLVPGVVKTRDGKLNFKGEEESQGMLLVDSAQMVDPVTGSFSIAIPTAVIQTLNVYKTPFNAQYGNFSGGLTTIETKPPSGSWQYGLTDPIPGVRGRNGHLVGISAETPQFYLSGPLVKDRLNFSETFDYTYRRKPVRGLAWPNNETETQGFNSYTSFQAILSSRHVLTTSIDVFPLRRQFADINSLVPQSASSNYGQKGVSIGVADNYQFGSGALLTTVVQYTKFDSNAYGQGPQDMLITPEGWGGNYFNTWTRNAHQFEALPILQLPRKAWHGSHELKVGADFTRRTYTGTSQSRPVQLLREDGSLAQRIDFESSGGLEGKDHDIAEFVQDHWMLSDRLALDLGARLSSQSLGRSAALAPRAGMAYSLNSKTLVRAGTGLFYDRVPLLAADFTDNPTRVVSLFDPAGSMVGAPVVYHNAYLATGSGPGVVRSLGDLGSSPRNFTWNVEVDRELPRNVTLRLGYIQSRTHNLFVLNPLPGSAGQESILGLADTGNSRYRELEATVRLHPGSRNELTISYVRSQTRGDLNTLSDLYVPFEQPVIRPNAYGVLKSDIPNRLVSSGIFQFPWKLTFSPVVDVHTGYPYSQVDVLQNYVGQPNSQRLPTYFSLDFKVYREFQVPFRGIGVMKHRKFRLGLYSLNVTNHSNPLDVYNNVTSRYFGDFAGFQHRVTGMVIDIVQ